MRTFRLFLPKDGSADVKYPDVPCLPLCIWEMAIALVRLLSGVHVSKPFSLTSPVHSSQDALDNRDEAEITDVSCIQVNPAFQLELVVKLRDHYKGSCEGLSCRWLVHSYL